MPQLPTLREQVDLNENEWERCTDCWIIRYCLLRQFDYCAKRDQPLCRAISRESFGEAGR